MLFFGANIRKIESKTKNSFFFSAEMKYVLHKKGEEGIVPIVDYSFL